MKIKNHFCDVLIAGAGAAGLRTAAALLEESRDIRVSLVVKGLYGRCGTTANAVSDRMAFHATMPYTPPPTGDNWKYHAEDIFRIGRYVSDLPLAGILAKESSSAVYYLDKIGVPFVKDEKGEPVQFLTDGSVYPRACYTGPYTASDMEKHLVKRLKVFSPKVYERHMIADVLTDKKGRVSGAVCIGPDNSVNIFNAGFVVLATGGAGGIFKDNCYPSGMTGDGYGAALRCGAELVNMEFIQFGLCSRKLKVACSGSLMRSIPRIVDDSGEEVLADVYRNPRDAFSVIFRKGASWPVSNEEESRILDILASRKGRLFLDYTENPSGWKSGSIPEEVRKWYGEKGFGLKAERPWERLMFINPEIYRHFLKRGVDISRERVEVFGAAQHFQGGIKIDANGESSVGGLFACGESAGGQHGANRPGGNALLDTQVFGRRVAFEILRRLKKKAEPALNSSGVRVFPEKYKGSFPEKELKKALGRTRKENSLHLAVHREKEELGRLKDTLVSMKEKVKPSENLRLYFETFNAILTSLAVVGGCLARTESRGPHLMWLKGRVIPSDKSMDFSYFVSRLQNGDMTISRRKVKKR